MEILWIEDDANMIMGLMKPLIKEGHHVDTALNVERAHQHLEKKKFDLIILDIILPSGKKLYSEEEFENVNHFNGVEFLKSLSEDSPPVLVLSVVNDSKTIEQINKYQQVKNVLLKGTIRPSQIKEEVHNILHL